MVRSPSRRRPAGTPCPPRWPPTSTSVDELAPVTESAPGDGGDDADDAAVVERGVDTLHEPDVLVGDEHVDEAAQLALVVEQPLGEAGMLRVECLQRLADRRGVDRHLGVTAREHAQL